MVVLMSEQACRGRPQIAVLMGFGPISVFFGLPRCEDETYEGFPMIPGKKLHSTPPPNPRNRFRNGMLLLQWLSGAEMSPNFLLILILSFIVSSCVVANSAEPSLRIVVPERMQLVCGPCEVGVYLPVCGHPGFMAVIQ